MPCLTATTTASATVSTDVPTDFTDPTDSTGAPTAVLFTQPLTENNIRSDILSEHNSDELDHVLNIAYNAVLMEQPILNQSQARNQIDNEKISFERSSEVSNVIQSKAENETDSVLQLDLLVLLSGELGNNLGKIATAKVLEWMAHDKLSTKRKLNPRFVTQGLRKSKSSRAELQTCFPSSFKNTNLAEFDARDNSYFQFVIANQTKLLRELWNDQSAERLLQVNHNNITRMQEQLNLLLETVQLMKQHESPVITSNVSRLDFMGRPTLSSPFLIADSMASIEIVDDYYERIREYFKFDDEACCNMRPYPDEAVLHFRAFNIEMPRMWKKLGFVELDPNRTANELLGHLPDNSRVAILSRFDQTHMHTYLEALQARNLIARSIDGQTGVQDFCFLKSSSIAAGTLLSTYFAWAFWLSDTQSQTILYSINITKYQQVGFANFQPSFAKHIISYPVFPELEGVR